jgi:hypothetical protein
LSAVIDRDGPAGPYMACKRSRTAGMTPGPELIAMGGRIRA